MKLWSNGILLLIVLAGVGLETAAAADWPTFQQNYRRNAKTSEQLNIGELGLAWTWRSPAPPQPAWSRPAKWDAYAGIRDLGSMRNYDPVFHVVVSGGRVFFGSSADGAVHCLDLASGKEKWVFFTEGPVRSPPSIVAGAAYFGSDDGHAYAVDVKTGRQIWKYRPRELSERIVNNGRLIPLLPIRSGVVVSEGVAYFAASLLPWETSYLCAVNARTGLLEGPGSFQHALPNVTFEGAMAMSPTRLIAPQGRVAPKLFSRSEGKSLGDLKGGGGCFVVLADESHIFHGPGNKKGWLKASDGKSRETIATYEKGRAIVVDGDVSYLLTNTSLIASDFVKRKHLWTVDCAQHHAVILAGDTLFAGGDDEIAAYAAKDGALLWRRAAPGRVHGLAVAGGHLLASTDQGAILSFSAGAAASPTQRIRAPEAIASGGLFQGDASTFQPPKIDDPALLGRWVFQREQVKGRTLRDLSGHRAATFSHPPTFERVGAFGAITFKGDSQPLVIRPSFRNAALPIKAITAEAWVRIDQPQPWGGIIGVIQDNGADEHGWLLGYKGASFSFGLASENGKGRLTYLTAKSDFPTGQWRHVAGVYDGNQMRLYVDGKLANTSDAQQGNIAYPEKASYELAAYHDQDEYFPLQGALHEVRVFRRVLSEEEIKKHAASKVFRTAPVAELAAGPLLRFVAPGVARVWWRTAGMSPSVLSYGAEELLHTVRDDVPKTEHSLLMTGLKHGRKYGYTITSLIDGKQSSSKRFECDNFFNYTTPKIGAAAKRSVATSNAALLDDIVQTLGGGRGLALFLGGETPEGDLISLSQALSQRTDLQISILSAQPEKWAAARSEAYNAGLLGSRISFLAIDDLANPPVAREVANLVVARLNDVHDADVLVRSTVRLLQPVGGVGYVGPFIDAAAAGVIQTRADLLGAGVSVTPINLGGDHWLRFVKSERPGMGDWSHIYGPANNSAYGGESLGGARSAADLEVRWVGRPGAHYQPDRNGRKPPPLSTSGRLFLQGLQRLITLDAHNGSILWSWEIPHLGRFNMPRDCGNWCADEEHLFVAVRDRCLQFDAATGNLLNERVVLPGPRNDWKYHWGYIARVENLLLGSAVKSDALYTSFWGGPHEGWYDGTAGKSTNKVCSDNLFALDPTTGQRVWTYQDGLILNCTITIEENSVMFVRSANAAALQAEGRRLTETAWADMKLTSLNLHTGKVQWERDLNVMPGVVVFFLAAGDGKLVLVSSAKSKYMVYGFSTKGGETLWKKEIPWWRDNHGAHMSRPAIVKGTVYVRPNVLDLKTGQLLPQKMPVRHGCGTYAATTHALIFRSGEVTVWDRKTATATQWTRLRPDCWLSTIPAAGMLLSPEGGGGCSCGSWMETSLGFAPKRAAGESPD